MKRRTFLKALGFGAAWLAMPAMPAADVVEAVEADTVEMLGASTEWRYYGATITLSSGESLYIGDGLVSELEADASRALAEMVAETIWS